MRLHDAVVATNDPRYRQRDSVAAFWFRTENATNGIAAKVIWSHPGGTQMWVTTQAKRGLSGNLTTEEWLDYMDTVTVDELLANHNVKVDHIYADPMDANLAMIKNPQDFRPYLDDLSGGYVNTTEPEDSEEVIDDKQEESTHPELLAKRESVPWTRPSSTTIQQLVRRMALVSNSTHSPDSSTTPLIKNATAAELEAAYEIVEKAMDESARVAALRYANPRRNKYGLKPGTIVDGGARDSVGMFSTQSEKGPEVDQMVITPELEAAAALVAEAEAVHFAPNVTTTFKRHNGPRQAGTYWMETLQRKGTVPWGDDPNYKVFRNVKDYGAKGDGVTDDTKAIKKAIEDGRRCGEKCNGSTTKNAIIYLPPGTYLVSNPLSLLYGTQLIGDASNWPTIVAPRTFVGQWVLSTDEYTGNGKGEDGKDQEWYVNTANFYRQIRNLRIDITATREKQGVACIHYQVAQATSLQNMELIAKSGTKQRGIFAENGSGGGISDVTFTGGSYGIYGGEQQFTAQRLKFVGCDVAVRVIWDWGWVWKSISVTNSKIGFSLLPERSKAGKIDGQVGSATFIDSSFSNVESAIQIGAPNSAPGSNTTGIVLENIKTTNVQKVVVDTTGKTLLNKKDGTITHWALGPVYNPKREFSMGKEVPGFIRNLGLLDSQRTLDPGTLPYFERPKPQYEGRPVSDFLHVKDFGAKGDGVTDDTQAFQKALNSAIGKILFVDAGTYILTHTVTIPSGSKIVGETWSQLAASGSFFGDEKSPRPMIKVGEEGSSGNVEMQDLIFTTKGPTPGAVLVEWNILADGLGTAALWDCHVRIGGASGTGLTPRECPPITSGTNGPACMAASLMMHITPKASGYFENMWLWVADHMIDDPELDNPDNHMEQTSIYVARGLLVESVQPTWLYSTSSEHAVFYQYNFHNARNIFAGMIQTESPYFQPTPRAPDPFRGAIGAFRGDPDYSCKANDEFSGCDSSWAVIMRGSQNVFIASAGLYSWFSTYTQDCIGTQQCQKALFLLEKNGANVRIQHLVTIGAKYMIVQDGKGILASDNLNTKNHPQWSQISVYEPSANSALDDIVWIDPKIWDMDKPAISCLPPCTIQLPPWTKATRTIDYPILTITDGNWRTTVTQPPMVVTEHVFKRMTITDNRPKNKKGKRAEWVLATFDPEFGQQEFWPEITYVAANGSYATTKAPNKPPPPITASNPPTGTWPTNTHVTVISGPDSPTVSPCSYIDPDCDIHDKGWFWQGMGPDDGGDGDNEDPEVEDPHVICPKKLSSTSTTKSPPTPKPSPMEVGHPSENSAMCYNSGQPVDHEVLDFAIASWCGDLMRSGRPLGPTKGRAITGKKNPPGNVRIDFSLDIHDGCEFPADKDLCARYLQVPVNSCNCGGVNGKQGGHVSNNCYIWRIDPNWGA